MAVGAGDGGAEGIGVPGGKGVDTVAGGDVPVGMAPGVGENGGKGVGVIAGGGVPVGIAPGVGEGESTAAGDGEGEGIAVGTIEGGGVSSAGVFDGGTVTVAGTGVSGVNVRLKTRDDADVLRGNEREKIRARLTMAIPRPNSPATKSNLGSILPSSRSVRRRAPRPSSQSTARRSYESRGQRQEVYPTSQRRQPTCSAVRGRYKSNERVCLARNIQAAEVLTRAL